MAFVIVIYRYHILLCCLATPNSLVLNIKIIIFRLCFCFDNHIHPFFSTYCYPVHLEARAERRLSKKKKDIQKDDNKTNDNKNITSLEEVTNKLYCQEHKKICIFLLSYFYSTVFLYRSNLFSLFVTIVLHLSYIIYNVKQ